MIPVRIKCHDQILKGVDMSIHDFLKYRIKIVSEKFRYVDINLACFVPLSATFGREFKFNETFIIKGQCETREKGNTHFETRV